MIVQAYPDRFLMIAQHDHADASGIMASMWDDSLFHGQDKRSSVEYAITNHDLGWKFIDEAPFWNERKAAPYTFTDYPTAPKTVLYRYGIEEVAHHDTYAALLCNRHYSRFLQTNTSDAAQKFIREQNAWHKNVVESMSDFNQDDYYFHYGILQMLDDISLFLCLNERGVSPENAHPFFKNGITKHEGIATIPENKVNIYWNDKQTVCLDPFPFQASFTVTLKQRIVMKAAIEQDGLIDCYQNAPVEKVEIMLSPVK